MICTCSGNLYGKRFFAPYHDPPALTRGHEYREGDAADVPELRPRGRGRAAARRGDAGAEGGPLGGRDGGLRDRGGVRLEPKLKGSIGEGPNHSNLSGRSSVRIQEIC